jgi:hypothetical protein
MPVALQKVKNTKPSFSAQRLSGLRLTIRTLQLKLPPLEELSAGNQSSRARIQGSPVHLEGQ